MFSWKLQSYRGRKPSCTVAPLNVPGSSIVPPEGNGGSVLPSVQPASRPSPQPTTVQQPMSVQQQPMVSFVCCP